MDGVVDDRYGVGGGGVRLCKQSRGRRFGTSNGVGLLCHVL
jgi:hypothetical protein